MLVDPSRRVRNELAAVLAPVRGIFLLAQGRQDLVEQRGAAMLPPRLLRREFAAFLWIDFPEGGKCLPMIFCRWDDLDSITGR